MPTHVALLRGINVGGRNRVAMADLRRILASLGHTDVATYIQSGNAVFTAATGSEPSDSAEPPDSAALAAGIEGALAAQLDVRPRVVVLSRDAFAQVVVDNPFADEPDPKKVHAVFSGDEPGPESRSLLDRALQVAAARGSADEAVMVGRTLFLHTPDGLGRSELAAALTPPRMARAARSDATARNWATVTRLMAMLDAP